MGDQFIGEIRLVGFNYPPREWAFCDGQLLSISENTTLFSLLGTTYGGDGRNTFALPDLRGRVAVGARQGPGLSSYSPGEKIGHEQVQLTTAQMPAHEHSAELSNLETTIPCSTEIGTSTTPSPTSVLAQGDVKSGRTDVGDAYIYNESTPNTTLRSSTVSGSVGIGNTGGNGAHENRQPLIALNYIIALNGIYPPRS